MPPLPLGGHLILPLNRPQYVMSPEALTTALAWSLYTAEPAARDGDERAVALIYRTDPLETQHLIFTPTEPSGDGLEAFGDALREAGVTSEGPASQLGSAVANALAGIQAEKSGRQPAAPLTPGLAMLQNMQGLQAARNPPAFAAILEALHELGGDPGGPSATAASLWRDATERRMATDPLVRSIDAAVVAALLADRKMQKVQQAPLLYGDATQWSGLLPKTPFCWFARMWTKLTSDPWVDALPPRVWADWASTVLRMAFGMGFLWEAAWYEHLARTLQQDNAPEWMELVSSVPDILPWRQASSPISHRTVASILGWRVRRGALIRTHLSKWLASAAASDEPLDAVLAAMRSDAKLSQDLRDDLGSRARGAANLWEAIRYTLLVREQFGPYADYYGLLRSRRGGYLTIDPATEWIAVVASLECPEPGGQTDVGAVVAGLDMMGLRPPLADLIALLEKAGMARGSADADQGVIVESAF